MKVLFLSQIVPYPPHGGVLQRGYNILRELGRRAEVHLLAFLHADELPTPAAQEESRRALQAFCARVEYHELWPKKSRLHTAAALAGGMASSRPFSVVAHRSRSFRASVAESLGRGQFDVVHVDTIALGQFIDGPHHVPSALTHHNIESMLMARRAEVESNPVIGRLLRRESDKLERYERTMSPRFDINILMSTADQRLFNDRVPNVRSAVVPNGTDTDYFESATEPDANALIYTGGMNMFANRDAITYFVDQVWPLIVARMPKTRFLAVGQDPPPELLAYAARDARIVVTGKVPDIRPYVKQAAVYVVPLRVGGGTRLKVLDAMASGKAIVSTTVGCEGLDVTPGEQLIVEDDPRRFAAAVIELLGDSARRAALGNAARTLAEQRYAWPSIGEALIGAYRQAIAARTAR